MTIKPGFVLLLGLALLAGATGWWLGVSREEALPQVQPDASGASVASPQQSAPVRASVPSAAPKAEPEQRPPEWVDPAAHGWMAYGHNLGSSGRHTILDIEQAFAMNFGAHVGGEAASTVVIADVVNTCELNLASAGPAAIWGFFDAGEITLAQAESLAELAQTCEAIMSEVVHTFEVEYGVVLLARDLYAQASTAGNAEARIETLIFDGMDALPAETAQQAIALIDALVVEDTARGFYAGAELIRRQASDGALPPEYYHWQFAACERHDACDADVLLALIGQTLLPVQLDAVRAFSARPTSIANHLRPASP